MKTKKIPQTFFYIKLLLIILGTGYFHPGYSYTERNLLEKQMTQEQIAQTLVMNQKWVKFPAYTDREGWNKLIGKNKQKIIRNGEALLHYKWQVIKATDYLEFERTGNRQVMEKPFDQNNRAIAGLLMAELAEGKGHFIDQLINGVFHSCEMTSWALAAHLITQPTHRSLPTDYQLIDLTAGDLGNLLSWTYYFMHTAFDKINPEISRRLYHELNKRIMEPYLNNNSFWWMALNYKGQMVNNWNPWCNSNALMTFMLLENNRELLSKAVYRSMQSVDKFLNYVHADGACEEGPSYWGHATGKLLDYLELLNDITGGKINIFKEQQIKNMGEYISRSYVGNGWVVNFADASAKGGEDPYLIYRYGKAVNSNELTHFAAYLYQQKKTQPWSGRDVYRTLNALTVCEELQNEKPFHNVPDYTWYPETEFYYRKNAKAFLAAKGGYNDESHNHNDAGTFSLWIADTPVIIDAGVGTYTRQTFSSERYKIWTMQSNYHNLPLINGQPQEYGRKYKATQVTANKNRFSANIAQAYGNEAEVTNWFRSYQLKNNQLVINDKFTLKQTQQPNVINFMVWGDVKVGNGKIIIQKEAVKATLNYDSKLFKPTVETITLTDPRLANVWGKKLYRISLTATAIKPNGSYTYTITY